MLPLTDKQVFEARVGLAGRLKDEGRSFREIRQILKCNGPEEARRLVTRHIRNQIPKA